jgi:ribosomal-protein-alanine N-acetyltransferase
MYRKVRPSRRRSVGSGVRRLGTVKVKVETRRFRLRDFHRDDRRGFLAYQADTRYAALQGPEAADPAHARALLETFGRWARERPRRNYQLAIVEKASGELVGCCGLRQAGCDEGSAELGIELAPDHWGRYALAIEIARPLLDFGFGRLGLLDIHGVTTVENRRVTRLARWFGAEAVATRPGPAWMSAGGWSEVEWRISRERWMRGARDQSRRQ